MGTLLVENRCASAKGHAKLSGCYLETDIGSMW